MLNTIITLDRGQSPTRKVVKMDAYLPRYAMRDGLLQHELITEIWKGSLRVWYSPSDL